jgi:hypothetical protein
MSEAAAVAESVGSGEHAVTPLELFFDLVFVFAITQVTALLSHDPSWHGVIRGALARAAVWWAWTGYAWLTSTLNVDEGGVRLLRANGDSDDAGPRPCPAAGLRRRRDPVRPQLPRRAGPSRRAVRVRGQGRS